MEDTKPRVTFSTSRRSILKNARTQQGEASTSTTIPPLDSSSGSFPSSSSPSRQLDADSPAAQASNPPPTPISLASRLHTALMSNETPTGRIRRRSTPPPSSASKPRASSKKVELWEDDKGRKGEVWCHGCGERVAGLRFACQECLSFELVSERGFVQMNPFQNSVTPSSDSEICSGILLDYSAPHVSLSSILPYNTPPITTSNSKSILSSLLASPPLRRLPSSFHSLPNPNPDSPPQIYLKILRFLRNSPLKLHLHLLLLVQNESLTPSPPCPSRARPALSQEVFPPSTSTQQANPSSPSSSPSRRTGVE